jgi:hypothetical protein
MGNDGQDYNGPPMITSGWAAKHVVCVSCCQLTVDVTTY